METSYLIANAFSSGDFAFVPTTTVILIFLVLFVVIIAGMWKMFEKAGQDGWAAIIPIYSTVIMLRMIKRPWWWVLLFLLPYIGIVVGAVIAYHVAKAFGKDILFAIGLVFLPFIFYPILGFGEAKYTAPQEAPAIPPSPSA